MCILHNIKSRWHFFSGVICLFLFFWKWPLRKWKSNLWLELLCCHFWIYALAPIFCEHFERSVFYFEYCAISFFSSKRDILFFVFSHKHSRCVYRVKQAHVLSIYFVMNVNVSWDVLFYTLLYTFAFIHLTLQCIQCVCSLGIKSMTLLVPQSTSWAAGRNAADWGLT